MPEIKIDIQKIIEDLMGEEEAPKLKILFDNAHAIESEIKSLAKKEDADAGEITGRAMELIHRKCVDGGASIFFQRNQSNIRKEIQKALISLK